MVSDEELQEDSSTKAKLEGVKPHKALTRNERRARNRRYLAVGVGTLIAASLVFMSFSYLLKSLPESSEKPKVKHKVLNQKPRFSKKKATKPKKRVRRKVKKVAPKIVRKGPAKLRASWKAGQPFSIVLNSNAVAGDKINIVVRAVSGEVLGRPSFYLKKTLVWPQVSGKWTVPIKKWGMPLGHLEISGQYDDARFNRRIYTGSADSQFAQKLRRYKKKISYFQQVERDQLYRITKGYLGQAEALLKAKRVRLRGRRWQAFYRDWKAALSNRWDRELKQFSQKRRNRYSFPELWLELKELRANLEREALALYQTSSKKRATASISPVVADYRQLKKKVSRLSVWR